MKKEKFNGLNFSSLEKLTRDEQRKLVGGYGNSSSAGSDPCKCLGGDTMDSCGDMIQCSYTIAGTTRTYSLNKNGCKC